MTPKNAHDRPPDRCRRCGSTQLPTWVAVDVNQYVGACIHCFDSAAAWGAYCPICGAMMCEHDAPTGACPQTLQIEGMPGRLALPPSQATPLPGVQAALEPIDVEEVELPLSELDPSPWRRQFTCTCSAPRYDGDDGWDRACQVHGVGSDEPPPGRGDA